MDELSPFTPPPEQKTETPLRPQRSAPSSRNPPTPAPLPTPPTHPSCSSLHSSPTPHLLSISPRCPTPTCPHHSRLTSLCHEVLDPPLYILSCSLCRAPIYPCDCCHEVAAHLPPPSPTSSSPASFLPFSACSHCGFLTLITPSLRRLLQLPPLLPLPSNTTLSIQSSIDSSSYLQLKTSAYLTAFHSFKAAVHTAKRRGRGGGKDGGESDTTDGGGDDQRVMPKVDESTLLRLREELLALGGAGGASTSSPAAVPSFHYGMTPVDTLPFSSHHLHVLHQMLSSHIISPAISPSSSSSASSVAEAMVAAFLDEARRFSAAEAALSDAVRRVKQIWGVVQRVRRTYLELEQAEQSQPRKGRRSSEEEGEEEEGKVDAAQSRKREVERGVMGILVNVLSCKLIKEATHLHHLINPHWTLLTSLNRILTPLYLTLDPLTRTHPSPSPLDPIAPLLPPCKETLTSPPIDDQQSIVLFCISLCRCLYCKVARVLKEAEYWSDRGQGEGDRGATLPLRGEVSSEVGKGKRQEGAVTDPNLVTAMEV